MQPYSHVNLICGAISRMMTLVSCNGALTVRPLDAYTDRHDYTYQEGEFRDVSERERVKWGRSFAVNQLPDNNVPMPYLGTANGQERGNSRHDQPNRHQRKGKKRSRR